MPGVPVVRTQEREGSKRGWGHLEVWELSDLRTNREGVWHPGAAGEEASVPHARAVELRFSVSLRLNSRL